MLKDLSNDVPMVNEANDSYFARALGADKRICYVHLSDEVRPVSLEGGIHLGAVEHGLGIFPVGHLLLRERGTEDIDGRVRGRMATEIYCTSPGLAGV